MLMVNCLSGFGAGGTAFFIEDCGSPTIDLTDASAATFTAANIGTPTSGRRVLVGYMTRDDLAITSVAVTINGNNAPVVSDGVTPASSSAQQAVAGFRMLQVDAGTTADIVVTNTGTNPAAGMHAIRVWAIHGLISNAAFDVAVQNGSTAFPLTGSIDVPAGGAAFAVFAAYDTTSTASGMTWTGLTEVYDQDDLGGADDYVVGAAYDVFPLAQVGLSVSANMGEAPAFSGLAVCSFGP